MPMLLAALLVGAPLVPAAYADPVEQVDGRLDGGLVVDVPVLNAAEVPLDASDEDGGLFQKNKPLAITLIVVAGVAAVILTAVVAYVGAVICCLCFVGGYYY